FHPDAVAGAVKESLHAAVVAAGPVTFAREETLHIIVNVGRGRALAHLVEGHLLAALHGVIKPSHRFAGAALHHRAGDVPEIAGLLGARKNIDDDRLVRAQHAMADLVRVTGLHAAG